MKQLLANNALSAENSALSPCSHTSVRICMHVRGVVRTDVRVMREAKALVADGYPVSIIDVECEPSLPSEERLDGIRIKHLKKSAWLIPPRLSFWRPFRTFQKLFYSTLLLIQTPADIYHAHELSALPACFLAACIQHKPLVFDAHELPLNEQPMPRWLYRLLLPLISVMVRRSVGVITVSEPIAKEIQKQFGAGEVTVIRNILPYQFIPKSDRLRQHLGLNPDVHIALYQGNLQSDRGLDNLVRAAAFLDKNTIIVLMGRDIQGTRTQLEELIASEGVIDRVRILPPVPYVELLEWTSSADIGLIVNPPDHSLNVKMSLPNKFFEYLMAGLPILASPLDAVSECIRNYDIGQILPSLAPSDVGAAINAMLADHTAISRLSRNAREAVLRDLCWEKECQRLLDFYQKILSEIG